MTEKTETQQAANELGSAIVFASFVLACGMVAAAWVLGG